MRLHHVQVACPPGTEPEARRFYGEGLGLTEGLEADLHEVGFPPVTPSISAVT